MQQLVQEGRLGARAVAELYGIDVDDPILAAMAVEAPPRRAMGDLAVPLAFELARRLRKAPRAIAQELAALRAEKAAPPVAALPDSSTLQQWIAGLGAAWRGSPDAQRAEALAQGATAHIDPADFPLDRRGTPYLAPQLLTGVHHGMRVMTEESFGPVVGIQAVKDDEEAIALMNDSRYGLTASIWTRDADAALRIGDRVETGTWFMNRCDYLDPALAWTGVKDSGRGCTLSRLGLETLTRPKSFHLRLSS